jgi:hypothetical protein
LVFLRFSAGPKRPALSQVPERVNGDIALDRALKASSLTFAGKPFHAVMEVGTGGEEYSGRLRAPFFPDQKFGKKPYRGVVMLRL